MWGEDATVHTLQLSAPTAAGTTGRGPKPAPPRGQPSRPPGDGGPPPGSERKAPVAETTTTQAETAEAAAEAESEPAPEEMEGQGSQEDGLARCFFVSVLFWFSCVTLFFGGYRGQEIGQPRYDSHVVGDRIQV